MNGTRSVEDVKEAIRNFTPAQWARLRLVADRYAKRCSLLSDDLLQEACARALSRDSRKCPTDIDVVKFLAEAMRSIAHGESEKRENRAIIVPIAPLDGEDDSTVELRDTCPNTEEALLDAEAEAILRKKAHDLFPDDAAACEIIDGILAGFDGEELRELSGLDKTAYDSKRRLIRRRLGKHLEEVQP